MNDKELANKIVSDIVLYAYHRWIESNPPGKPANETWYYGVVTPDAVQIVEKILNDNRRNT